MVEVETVVLALVLVAAGALYFFLVEQPKKQQLLDAQRLKQKVAEQNAERAAAAKKPKAKAKRVDAVAEKKKLQGHHADHDATSSEPEHPLNLHVLRGHKYAVTAAAYSPNGRFIATASTDRTIRLYPRETLHDKSARPQTITIEYDHVTAMTFSCDGKTLVVVTEGGLLKMYRTFDPLFVLTVSVLTKSSFCVNVLICSQRSCASSQSSWSSSQLRIRRTCTRCS